LKKCGVEEKEKSGEMREKRFQKGKSSVLLMKFERLLFLHHLLSSVEAFQTLG